MVARGSSQHEVKRNTSSRETRRRKGEKDMLPKKRNSKTQLLGALGMLPLCLLPVTCASSPENTSKPPTFRNPIHSTADPFVMRHNNQYYLTGTSTGSSLELWHSPNLETIGQR